MESLISIAIGAIFVNNFVLSRFLGICPFIGVSRRTDAAIGMGIAVTFVMGVASMVTWLLDRFLLEPLGLRYLHLILFILVIAALVQLLELYLRAKVPALYRGLGIYLPLITTNCAVLGVALLNFNARYTFLAALVNGVGGGLGFLLALLLMSAIRERIAAGVPTFLEGTPIAFITASLLSLAFLAFAGMMR